MSKDFRANTGIVTVSFLVLGKVDARPPGWPCNGTRFVEDVRRLVEFCVKSPVCPLLMSILVSPEGEDETIRLLQGPGDCTLVDIIVYRWERKYNLLRMKHVINLEVVEDGGQENIFEYIELGRSKRNQSNIGADSSISSSSDQWYAAGEQSDAASSTNEIPPSSMIFWRYESDPGSSRFCSVM